MNMFLYLFLYVNFYVNIYMIIDTLISISSLLRVSKQRTLSKGGIVNNTKMCDK